MWRINHQRLPKDRWLRECATLLATAMKWGLNSDTRHARITPPSAALAKVWHLWTPISTATILQESRSRDSSPEVFDEHSACLRATANRSQDGEQIHEALGAACILAAEKLGSTASSFVAELGHRPVFPDRPDDCTNDEWKTSGKC
jgi:hypothetical protein